MPNRGHGTDGRLVLRTAIGQYPHASALRDGRISSNLVTLDFADIPIINRAFAPMVREQRFDVSEMAIVTFLQAKAFEKPLVLLPVVLAARSQHSALLCRADSDIRGPHDLAGRRVGVRAYSQTTGVWLRGMLADAFGVRPEQVRWITFEDAHVVEYRDPPWAERAPPGKELVAMLRHGELDAIIVGNDFPNDPTLRTVFPDPEAAAESFWHEHGFLPVNHLLTVRAEIARSRPDVIFELVRLFRDAKAAAPLHRDSRDPYPCERKALEPAVELALRYAVDQGLLPHRLDAANVWEGLPPGFASGEPTTTDRIRRCG
jgi:4,5-dihydroxyphthalate decarboxylase